MRPFALTRAQNKRTVFFALFAFFYLFSAPRRAPHLLYAAQPVFPQKGEGVNVSVDLPVVKGGNSNDQTFANIVNQTVVSRLTKYTKFTVINLATEQASLNAVAKSESELYNESTMLKAGEILSAKYSFSITMDKANGLYRISIALTQLETNRTLAAETCTANSNDIFSSVSVDNLLYSILYEQLGFPLTSIERDALLHRNLAEETASDLEKRKQEAQQELQELQRQNQKALQENRDRYTEQELAALKEQQEVEEALKRAEFEALKQRAQDKLEQEKRAAQAQTASAQRSAQEQLEYERLQAAIQMEKDKYLTAQDTRLSAEEQIDLIETKKLSLSKILDATRAAVKRQEAANKAAKDEELREAEASIRDPANKSFYSNGKLNKKGEEALKTESRRISAELAAANRESRENLIKTSESYEKEIIKDIDALNRQLRETQFSDSSYGNANFSIVVEDYDGDRESWKIRISFYMQSKLLFSDVIYVSYTQLTGKPVATWSNREAFREMQRTINMYDTLFQEGKSLIYGTIEYQVASESSAPARVIRPAERRANGETVLSDDDYQFVFPATDSRYRLRMKRITLTLNGQRQPFYAKDLNKAEFVYGNQGRLHVWTSREAFEAMGLGVQETEAETAKQQQKAQKAQKPTQTDAEKFQAEGNLFSLDPAFSLWIMPDEEILLPSVGFALNIPLSTHLGLGFGLHYAYDDNKTDFIHIPLTLAYRVRISRNLVPYVYAGVGFGAFNSPIHLDWIGFPCSAGAGLDILIGRNSMEKLLFLSFGVTGVNSKSKSKKLMYSVTIGSYGIF